MSELRKFTEAELPDFIEIVLNAYPGTSSPSQEVRDRMLHQFNEIQTDDESRELFGLYRDNKLIAGMRIYYYHMNLFSKMITVGGVGMVAVDLLHKKEKAAKELIEGFLDMFLEKGVNMVLLYPFRPDFYKKMGFGYGPKMHQYQIRPDSFPKGPSKANLRYMTAEDKERVRECYNRYAEATHGMFLKTQPELEAMFKNPANRFIGFEANHELKGYLLFSFEKKSTTNFAHYDLLIKELIAETPEALMEISTFLHSQADQVHQVVWNTQEENAHFLINDPRNGSHNLIPSVYHESSLSGVGLMYRVINTKGIFEDLQDHSFNAVSLTMKLSIEDTFLAQNSQELVLHFIEGKVEISDSADYEVEVSLDVSDFSSLLMGVVSFKELYQFGRAKLSNLASLNTVNRLFLTFDKPRCISAF
ncbi:enhanced intracellular survival protein Eis [Neobacillus niacini]|uniref:GNAT family N-acetyltransferase n=1 Tax=Neobacillus niacini TaxID=86668 RepID=UPI0021CB6F3C|nr:GNAT family N-acetyltransferase [Neobacillus niacini]MCM3764359.1 GNAT family N-acetyltransferase [Neobacillus niacini]